MICRSRVSNCISVYVRVYPYPNVLGVRFCCFQVSFADEKPTRKFGSAEDISTLCGSSKRKFPKSSLKPTKTLVVIHSIL